MSIEQDDVIDIVADDEKAKEVRLIVSDHLDWSATREHLLKLQRKLNAYFAGAKNPDFSKVHVVPEGFSVVIEVAFRVPPNSEALEFLAKAGAIIESAGLRFRYRNFPEPLVN